MKNRAIISLLIFSILILFYSIAFSGERPKNFRGLVWGTPISKIQGLVFEKDGEQGIQFYNRPSDNLKVGNIQVNAIRYKFSKNQLMAVVLDVKTYNQYLSLKSLFLDIYGPPDKEEDDRDKKYGGRLKHFWYTKNNDEANISLY